MERIMNLLRRKVYSIVIAMILLSLNSVYGQEKKEISVNLSYFGETIVHPGFEIGYENTFFKGFNFTVSIGTYVHQRNHTGLFLNGGINWRHTFPIGYSPEIGIGLGYLHTWPHGGPVYAVDDNDNLSITRSGRSHFMPTVKLGILGWDLRQKTNIPMRINTDIVVFGQYPFNSYMLPHFALKIGGTYYFTYEGELNK
jgi:hypothetical protein